MPMNTPLTASELSIFEANAAEVARILKALANTRRLMILCTLAAQDEASAGQLAEAVGLSQSALSQHLALMREEGLVTFRRESQTLWYRLADNRTGVLLRHLQELYCPTDPHRQDPTDPHRQEKTGDRP